MNMVQPAALHYVLRDEIYLLAADYDFYRQKPNSSDVPKKTPELSFKYSGNYKNGFLIITHYPEYMHIEPSHLTALESTLKRIGIDLGDSGILNLAMHGAINYDLIIEHLQPKKLLILGIAALPFKAPFASLNKQEAIGGISGLYTFSFGEMIGNKENTKLFWNQIKQL